MFDYNSIKELAGQTGIKTKDLIVLSSGNDPFYADVPHRRERAEWFAQTWDRFGFQHGSHLRRIHYRIANHAEPVLWPNGDRYLNTQNDWKALVNASLTARYLGLIQPDVLVDRRNPAPMEIAYFRDAPEPNVYVTAPGLDFDLPDEFPVPELVLSRFHRDQDFLVEVWAEKSTQNDILVPLARRLGFNLVIGLGEMSETATRLAVERAVDANRPMRILYVSDFDPAGRSMPVAVARKIEHKLHSAGIDADITLQPIVLTPEQCAEFQLPRIPIDKDTKRAPKFEHRFGTGATELDALEGLHPGKLAEIIEREVCRYIDPTLQGRVRVAESEINREIAEVENGVSAAHTDSIEELNERYDAISANLAALVDNAEFLWERMSEELEDARPAVDASKIPVARDPNPVEAPLYSSDRGYLEQLDAYREWQGK